MKVDKKLSSLSSGWSFSGKVAENFQEHVKKSVPFYSECHDLICDLSEFFVNDQSICYEIGSSAGELINKMHLRNEHKKAYWIGLDIEKDMVKVAKKKIRSKRVKIYHKDIITTDLKKSDLIVSYYTMQFIKPKVRQKVFDKIYNSLNWGGAFILFEKVRAPDARFQDITTQLYSEFKKKNGFTAEEILNKTSSLKSVLEPFSSNANIDLMKRSGFNDILSIFKFVNFEGFLAIK